jgi:8-oxo-dGTP diphosphatase
LNSPRRDAYLERLYTFGDPHRNPRSRVVTVAYYALVPTDESLLLAGTGAAKARWYPVSALPPLAFDHGKIVEYAIDRLRNKLEYTNVGFQLLPAEFTPSASRALNEAILGKPLDKRNLGRKIWLSPVMSSKEMQATGRKPALLFSFRQRR